MQSWWELNPEYEYVFFSDAQALQWVAKHATATELQVYKALRLGPQRCDVFRLLYCKLVGCVYADLDQQLFRPLRELIPPDASAVAGSIWPYEWLMFEARPSNPAGDVGVTDAKCAATARASSRQEKRD